MAAPSAQLSLVLPHVLRERERATCHWNLLRITIKAPAALATFTKRAPITLCRVHHVKPFPKIFSGLMSTTIESLPNSKMVQLWQFLTLPDSSCMVHVCALSMYALFLLCWGEHQQLLHCGTEACYPCGDQKHNKDCCDQSARLYHGSRRHSVCIAVGM